jgi:hypothetical protein
MGMGETRLKNVIGKLKTIESFEYIGLMGKLIYR